MRSPLMLGMFALMLVGCASEGLPARWNVTFARNGHDTGAGMIVMVYEEDEALTRRVGHTVLVRRSIDVWGTFPTRIELTTKTD